MSPVPGSSAGALASCSSSSGLVASGSGGSKGKSGWEVASGSGGSKGKSGWEVASGSGGSKGKSGWELKYKSPSDVTWALNFWANSPYQEHWGQAKSMLPTYKKHNMLPLLPLEVEKNPICWQIKKLLGKWPQMGVTVPEDFMISLLSTPALHFKSIRLLSQCSKSMRAIFTAQHPTTNLLVAQSNMVKTLKAIKDLSSFPPRMTGLSLHHSCFHLLTLPEKRGWNASGVDVSKQINMTSFLENIVPKFQGGALQRVSMPINLNYNLRSRPNGPRTIRKGALDSADQCQTLTGKGVLTVLVPSLTTLDLSGQGFPNRTVVVTTEVGEGFTRHVAHFFSRLTNLTTLKLSGVRQITHFLENLPLSVTTLDISHTSPVETVLARIHPLKDWNLSYTILIGADAIIGLDILTTQSMLVVSCMFLLYVLVV